MLKEIEQNLLLTDSRFLKQRDYWLDKLSGNCLNPNTLFEPGIKTFSSTAERIDILFTPELSAQILKLSKGSDLSINIILLAGLKILVHRYTGGEDILVASPVNMLKATGEMMNHILWIRDLIPGEMTFKALLLDIRESVLGAYENQDYPFDRLLQHLEHVFPRRSLVNKEYISLSLKNLHEEKNIQAIEGKISFAFEKDEEMLQGRIIYDPGIFKKAYIEQIAGHFTRILQQAAADITIKLKDITFLHEKEKQQLLFEFNNMASEFPANTTLHQLFEEQTSRTPDHIAVIGHGHAFTTRTNTDNIISITYHQLNEQAGRLAGVLIEKGVLPDYIVGIMIERSIEMIVGILGILKAGGAYLPIEPDYPQERVDYMLKDSGAKVLLINKSEIRNPKLETNPNKTNSNDPNKNQNSGATLVLNFENLNFEFVSNFVLRASNLFSSNLAYIIYTSGSTGRPKGVLIEHRNVVSLLFNEKFQFDFNDRDIWTMFHSYCFDFSVWEMYGALLYGGKLVIINKITARDTLSYLKILKRERVTILNQTPSAFYNLLNIELNNPGIELKTRYVIFGGEALTPSLLQKWKSKYPRTKLINMYGITETTVHVTYKEIGPIELESTASIIGKPIPTLNVYVMDKNLQLLPIGAPGELVVGGKGVARGYLNQPELTAEKFGPLITLMTQMSLMKNKNIAFRANFQHTAFSILHSKFYCTGDLCKWLPDGNIEFLGRIDHQVKIRGFRIELGEIEHLLCGYPGVKAVVVADKESTPGNRLLCAYIAMKEGYKTEKSTNSAELKEYLAKKLPGYMIPSFFELMDELPLTPNGKIDRQALPQPAPASGVDYIAPRSETEKRLAEIWGEVLEIKAGKIGIDNHFFQLGGHSLTATILAALVHKKFDVNIPLTEIFSTPILKDLARYIEENADSHIYLRLEPAEEREYYVLSSAQKRLYVIQQMDPGSIVYNMPGVMILLGQLDRVKFEESFKKLIQRHESLRTSFHMLDEEPVQRIHDEVEFEITYKDLAVNGGEEKTEVFGSPGTFFQKGLWPPEAIIKSFIQPFDLSKAPLLRVSLIKESAQKHILLIDMNHIISDGTSIGILANEFMALVAGKDLEPLRFQYRDWAQWQNYEKNSQQVKKQEAYWLNEFAGKIPVLNLPCDYKRPAVQDFTGKRVTFTLSPQDTESLNTLARLEEVTLYILLLSAYCVLLYKLTDREDIVIGAPTAGRLKVELQQIIGMFLNTLALRNFPGDTKPFKLFLKEVKEKVLKAFENQEYQFDDLVDRLGVKREGGRNPLFDVMFILQNHSKTEIRIPGLELKTVEREHTTTKFDFSLYAEEEGRELIFNVTYNLKLFTPVTITIIIDYFKAILSDIIKNPHQALADIKVVSGESRAAILAQLNQDLESEAGAIMGDGIFQSRLQQSLLRFKDNIAVEYSGNSVSYGELDRHSNLICRRILNRGITGNTFIGMLINHRLQLIVTLLGIIKVGSVIVPLYPGYPTERLEEMIDITGLKYLFIDEENTPRFKKDSGVEFIDPYGFDFDPREEKEHGDNSDDGNNKTAVIYNPGDPLYIHFTSGSTGKPKAILGKNRGLLHFISWEITTLGINSDFHAAQFTIPGFDPFLRDVFAPLLAGGVISIPGQEDIVHHAVQLTYYIEQRRISLIHCVTGLFRLIISSGPSPDYFRNLKYILLAGEKTNPSDLIEWYETFGERVQLLNCYGPTETTMSKAFYFIKPGDIRREKIPVGRPLVGARIVILDENNNLCAPLTPGEICIRTPFGSCGYFNAPALNREKFIPNPFSSAPGDLIYRSGDLGRILADGNLDILGRTDRQVKIRGYRVEPADIERHLINHPEIKDAMVLPLGDDRQDIFLCAYIIPQRSFTVSELREYLSPKLPDYMIPTYFVQMERFPLTARGKIDRGALPEPGTGVAQNFIAPANEIEKKLLGMWSEVLAKGENEIGVGIDFVESGGHSLKAAVLAAKIHKEFDVNVPLAEFFKTMTIRGLSQYIRVLGKELHLDIEPTEKKWFYPLSSAQRRLYFLQMMEVNSSAYNIPRVMKINGKINIERLENVFKRLILEHESLRVSFHMVGEDPVQKIHDHAVFEIEYKNLTTVETEKKIHQATFIIHHFIRAFDLSKAPLLRVGLLKTAEEEFILMVDMHHIISDGVSIQVLVRDFSTLYAGKELPGIKLQYKDYAEWQNRERFSQKLLTQGGYWKKECEGEIPVLELPTDYSRPPVQSFEGNWINFEIDKETSDALQALVLEAGATLYIVLLAIYTIFLLKLSGREDIVVGSPVAGRRHVDLENIIGIFVNTLALRNYPVGEKKFNDFLEEVKERTFKALENQEFQYEDLVEMTAVTRDVGRNPLFDTMFTLQNTGSQEIEIPGLKIVPYELENKTSKFDLSLTAAEAQDKLLFIFEYSTKLFKKETLERFIVYFKNIINSVVENKNRKVFQLEILTEKEKKRILFEFNDTEAEYPEDKTIHQLFEEQVERTPDHIALVGANRHLRVCPINLSYRHLNEQSGRLAGLLIEKGALPDTIVGIMMKRSIEMVTGVLGILKSGGAYLPIEPEYPEERINYILKDSGAKILLTDFEKKKMANCQLLINAPQPPLHHHSSFILNGRPSPRRGLHHSNQLSYIIYTSGTTGKPKGVMIEHQGMVNHIYAKIMDLQLDHTAVVAQNASQMFDISVWQFFSALITGGRTVIVPDKIILEPMNFMNHILVNKITVLEVVPSYLAALLDLPIGEYSNSSLPLQYLLVTGEAVNPGLLKKWFFKYPGINVVNAYGPTEASDDITHYIMEKVPEMGQVPIGSPVQNMNIFILDKYMTLCPQGVPGELCVTGAGIGRGYLNRPELTAEKFGPQITLMTQMSLMKNKDSALRANFHHSSFIIHHSILYRTGDLARWLNDGNIEFLGRIDHQVKIRGFRIELEEIETRLVNHPDIKEAVVLAQEGEKGDKYLCAYIVTDREYKTSWIREFLAQELPGYMIPSYFVKIEKIPLTPNGKVNRGALPKPGLNINEGYIAARDKIETKLVEIWSEALGKDECHAIQLQASIGIDDNFFEWGGHSLKAMILASKIHKAFEVKIPLLEIFRNPTVRGLSNYIRNAAKNEYSAITPVEKKLYYDLSHAQNRLWILDKMEENQVAYNMPGTWESAELNREAFEKAVAAVIKRHEILRTTFITCEGIPKQKIHNYEALDFNPIYIDLRNEENKESLLIELKEKEENTPFNLEKGPLLRTKLLHIEENRHLFLFTMHHIISDGWSMDVMKKEFITLYDAYANGNVNPLPPLIIQYKDYTVWHNRQLSGEKLKGHRNYWLNRLSGEIPVLQLPTDYPRPKIKSFAGEYIFFSLSKEITGHLQQIGKECGSTLFITFLAAINVFLSGYTGQTDIIVGTPVAGREHKDLENQIGFYVNMLPLRNKLIRNETFRELLQRIKFDTLEAFEHQVYPFDQLVKDLNLTRDVSRNPLFDVVAAVQTAQTDYHQPGQIQGLNLTGENHGDEFLEIGFGASKHDLRFLLIETGNHADIHIQYNPDLFRMERILIMKEQFINLLTRLTTGIDKNLDSFDFLISIENKQSGMKFQGGF